jgi:formamidopyrimidine-DNA glycosylase
VPELPEVEYGRRIAEAAARGRRIVRVECARDPIVFDGAAPAAISRALEGSVVRAVRRRGKHLYFELDRRPWPIFHFGMSGAFRVPGTDALPLASGPRPRDAAWPPRFTKIRIALDGAGGAKRGGGAAELVMTDARRLGRIRLREDPLREPPLALLGFDALLELPPPKEFAVLLAERRAPIKAVLLDQTFAAGVGNWIADEVLYQARIDPRRRASDLDEAEARRLRARIASVLAKAVAVDADKDRFPRTWLFHRRWGKPRDARTARDERIAHVTIGGRTTAWVPSIQR